MQQHEYLRELRINLERGLSQEAVEDIIADYEGFFVSGREEGKDDNEISEQLGSPAFLAKSLLEEHEQGKMQQPDKKIANPGRRLCAYMIDAVIAVLPGFVATMATGSTNIFIFMLILYPAPLLGLLVAFSIPVFDVLLDRPVDQLAMIAMWVSLLFYLLYSLVTSLIFSGQTIGKKIMGIRVRSYNEQAVSKSTLTGREMIGKVVMNSVPFVALVSLFTMLFTKEHKALHDMLADTIVSDADV